MSAPRRGQRAGRLLVTAVLLAWCACAREKTSPEATIERVTIADATTHWQGEGFVEMAPPIRLPSRDGNERIEVWLRIPDGALLRVRRGDQDEVSIAYPQGTIADRVDVSNGADPASVADVRGTHFEDGRESFHVLRPTGMGQLQGVAWPRESVRAGREATDWMLGRLTRAGVADGELRIFEARNDCASCHAHDKPERHYGGRDGSPNRGTDADGLYVVQSVLADGAPLERHRARDMNVGDPFVSVTCDGGTPARLASRGFERHFACEGAEVPYGHYDMRAALAAADPHALAVCASRRYLYRHLDEAGRAAFAHVFDECGLPCSEGAP